MNKRIQTYEELIAEKRRLQYLLEVQRDIVQEDINRISEELKPIKSLISVGNKLVTRDGNNFILNAGANTIIDLVVKKLLLSRAGWLTKRLVPFFLKNYSSHFISENKETIMSTLFSWIGKRSMNGHKKEV